MVGSHIVERLVEEGVEVRAFIRPMSDTSYLQTLPVQVRRGEIADGEAIRRAMEGIQIVFHAAGYLHMGSAFAARESFTPYRVVNIDFTEALLDSAVTNGVTRFVYVSSVAVYGPEARAPISEESPLEPVSSYGRSKVVAEAIVQSYHRSKGLATTVIRPCIIYGPRDRHFLPGAIKLANLPILPLVDGGRRRIDLVHVNDVVDLMLLAGRAEQAIGRVYNAASGAPPAFREVLEAYRRVAGRAARIVTLPPYAFVLLGPLLRYLLVRMAPGVEGLINPVGIAYLKRDVYFDMRRAREELKYAPRIAFEQGLTNILAADSGH